MATPKNIGHVMYGVFKKKFEEANSERPPALRVYNGNRYRDAAMLKAIVEDVGQDTVLEIMDFYFEHRSKHEVSDLVFNYDSLLHEMEMRERDKKHLEGVRERTRQRLEELGVEL